MCGCAMQTLPEHTPNLYSKQKVDRIKKNQNGSKQYEKYMLAQEAAGIKEDPILADASCLF